MKKKFKGRKKNPQYYIISFYWKDISAFNELVIKSTPAKKEDYFAFYGTISPTS